MSEEKAELQVAESAAAILSAPSDTVYAVVDVPEWGCKVRVRSLTSEEWALYQAGFRMETRDGKEVRNMEAARLGPAKMLALAAVNTRGERLFTADQTDALARKNIGPVIRVVAKVLEISGVTERAAEDARGN